MWTSDSNTDKSSDYLILMYMDGDNSLESVLLQNLNQVEYGLYTIRNSSGYASVNVVVLWDGDSSCDSKLYEVGADSSYNYQLSDNTVTVSGTPSWLSTGEVNMGDPGTLTNFLTWAKNKYSAANVILQFADHGGGPRSTSSGTDEERALCQDETNNDILYTAEVSTALANAGYSSSNQLGIILMDVCFGASIEDAYQFQNYAHYFAASPNSVPGNGLNYTDLIKSFTSSSSLKSIGIQMVSDFKTQYHRSQTSWDSLPQNKTNYYIYNKVYTYSKTFSFIDLSKIAAVKSAVDAFASSIQNESSSYLAYLKYNAADETTITNSLAYSGSYAWLYDIGYFAYQIYTNTSDETIKSNAQAVMSTLNGAVVSSWRDAPDTTYGGNLYTYIQNTAGLGYAPFGITITGATSKGEAPSWYRTDLAFGADSTWANLLSTWF